MLAWRGPMGRKLAAGRLAAAVSVVGLLTTVAVVGSGCRKGAARDGKEAASPPIITTKLGVEMVHVPAGWFQMGSADGPANEQPAHKVWVGAFLIDRTEVTQGEFRRLQIPDPSHFKHLERPVEQVTFTEVIEFCNERSDAEGLKRFYTVDEEKGTWQCDFDADGYRLPTEAEWEYACRAGSAGDRFFESGDQRMLARYAWYADSAAKTTHPAARKKPNAWGLYDMYGNVAEWCNDFYKADYYGDAPQRNPRGPLTSPGDVKGGPDKAELVVLRGGGWDSPAELCRSAWRAGENPKFQDICFAKDTIGFRCARSAPKE